MRRILERVDASTVATLFAALVALLSLHHFGISFTAGNFMQKISFCWVVIVVAISLISLAGSIEVFSELAGWYDKQMRGNIPRALSMSGKAAGRLAKLYEARGEVGNELPGVMAQASSEHRTCRSVVLLIESIHRNLEAYPIDGVRHGVLLRFRDLTEAMKRPIEMRRQVGHDDTPASNRMKLEFENLMKHWIVELENIQGELYRPLVFELSAQSEVSEISTVSNNVRELSIKKEA